MGNEEIGLSFDTTTTKGPVSATFARPQSSHALLVLGHGAGTSMGHPFMQSLSEALNSKAIATFRFNYPYSEKGRGMDGEKVRLATVRAAMASAVRQAPDLPLFAGGHSMSGRMISMAAATEPVEALRGIIFFAFPLHAGKANAARAEHLQDVDSPMLFLSGERDKMADWPLLTAVVADLGPRAALHQVDTADHGFKVLKRRTSVEPVMAELARVTCEWIGGQLQGR